MARASSVCVPDARSVISTRDSQLSNCAPSSEHSNSSTSISSLCRPMSTSGPEIDGASTMNVSGGSVSSGGMISHSYHSGVESTTPDGLTERTWNTCGPIVRPSTTSGDAHGRKSSPSSEHSKSNSAFPLKSSPRNSKIATVPSVSSSGPISIDVSGEFTSTYIHERVAGVGSTLPISSIARTCTVCRPYAPSSSSISYGTPGADGVLRMDEHEPTRMPSSRHSYSSSMSSVWSSSPVNSSWITELAEASGGPLTICVSGGVVSSPSATSHSYSVGSAWVKPPIGLNAWTSNLWSPVWRCVYVLGDSQSVKGRPSSEHCSIEPGTSAAKWNVALPLSDRTGGAEKIVAIGATSEPCARAMRPKSSGSAQTSPLMKSFFTVMSAHSLPSNASRRAGPSTLSAALYGTQRKTGSPYSAVVFRSKKR